MKKQYLLLSMAFLVHACALDTGGSWQSSDGQTDDGIIDGFDLDVTFDDALDPVDEDMDAVPDPPPDGEDGDGDAVDGVDGLDAVDLADALDADMDADAGCTIDEECSNGDPCDGIEVCLDDGTCGPGEPLADGTPCDTDEITGGTCRGEVCAPAGCGNGFIDSGEECDDGNTVRGDGCENDCEFSCHTVEDCIDGSDCTEDHCNAAGEGQMCEYVILTGPCDDDDPCTYDDTCSETGTCIGIFYTCTPGVCERSSLCDGDGGCTPVYEGSGTVCNDGLYCTVDDRCDGAGTCVGTGNPCEDAYTCTGDICAEGSGGPDCSHPIDAGTCLIGGRCFADGAPSPTEQCRGCVSGTSQTDWSSLPAGSPCVDGLFCTEVDTCDAAGNCTGTGDPCGDGNDCTVDSCDEGTDTCNHTVQAGFCFIGNVCYAGLVLNPANECLRCHPATNPLAWSPVPPGAPCDDGLFCTAVDACNGSGTCLGTGSPCDDGISCTINDCNEGSDSCSYPVASNYCLIGSTCYLIGTLNPVNDCQVCTPSSAQRDWSAVLTGTGCDDGLYCTATDTCDGLGSCIGTGNPCSDGISCTIDNCNETGDTCDYPVQGGWCLISGTCYSRGAANPSDTCLVCDDTVSQTAWSPAAPGTGCDDGLFCTATDTCNSSGVCTGTGSPCVDGLSCTTDSCDEDGNSCSNPVQAGWCVIDHVCYGHAQLNPADPCQMCDSGVSQTGWSPSPPGGDCDDGLFCTTVDQCDGLGSCGGFGNPCGDGLTCTDDVCTEGSTTYSCSYPITAGNCLIGGLCYANGALNPANDCQACLTAQSTTTWSNRPSGAACTDPYGCTADTCNGSGICVGTPDDALCPPGELCRPLCFSSTASGCGLPPSGLDLTCVSPVTIPGSSACDIDLSGMTGQVPCLACSAEAGQVTVDYADFGDAEGTCSMDGWSPRNNSTCCDNLGTCAPSTCNRSCCSDTGSICHQDGSSYFLWTARQECSREEWRLDKTFDFTGLQDMEICFELADRGILGDTDEGILIYVSAPAQPAVQIFCLQGEPQYNQRDLFYPYCAALPAWADDSANVTVTLMGHAEDNGQYLLMDNVRVKGWVRSCAANATRIFHEPFGGCPNPITNGWNGWTVSGTPDCPGSWSCGSPSTSPSAQANDETWTITRTVSTSAYDGNIELCFSIGDDNGGTSLLVQFNAQRGAGWQTAWYQTGDLGPDQTCRHICVNLSDMNRDAARNPALLIRFDVNSNVSPGSGYYDLDDVEVWGSTYCNGAPYVRLSAIAEAGSGHYGFSAVDLTNTPMSPIMTCSWDSPPAPVSDFTYVDFIY
jgi:hypothetical protein